MEDHLQKADSIIDLIRKSEREAAVGILALHLQIAAIDGKMAAAETFWHVINGVALNQRDLRRRLRESVALSDESRKRDEVD